MWRFRVDPILELINRFMHNNAVSGAKFVPLFETLGCLEMETRPTWTFSIDYLKQLVGYYIPHFL